MWKYYVTYMLVVATPILREIKINGVLVVDSDGKVVSPEIPPITYKIDTLSKIKVFGTLKEAEDFINEKGKRQNGFHSAYTKGGYESNFKLDSIKVKN